MSTVANLSAFQTLPDIIVDDILKLVVEQANYQYLTELWEDDGIRDESQHFPLFSLSAKWRHAISKLVFKNNEAKLTLRKSGQVGIDYQPVGMQERVAIPLAKKLKYSDRVDIDLSWNAILSGKPIEESSLKVFSPETFCRVTSVRLNLVDGRVSDDVATEAEALERVEAFVAYIRALFPKAAHMSVVHVSWITFREGFGSNLAMKCTEMFFRKVPSIVVGYSSVVMQYLLEQPDFGCGLKALVCNICSDSDAEYMELIQRNSATLETLEIFVSEASFRGNNLLVAKNGGAPIAYPKLKRLQLMQWCSPYSTPPKALQNHVPFPSLVSLSAFGAHPFSDDMLFRGNQETLSFVTLEVDQTLLDVVERCKLFTGSNAHSRLQRVKLFATGGRQGRDFDTRKMEQLASQIRLVAREVVEDF
ncbi:hypothetical protein GGI07_005857 [Coemansia sp. Benny D115]|nr:hypothetical protein GGI07_005857 [Coemansia sp. Benny D115]